MVDAGRDVAEPEDFHVARLAALFAGHPAWLEAARWVRRGASSRVFFSHRPGEVWHLVRTREGSRLSPGPGEDPDFAFRFTPGAIERLCAVEGGVGDFAEALFERVVSEDASTRVDLRVIAPFRRLAIRGYLALLMAAAPRLAVLRARHGVETLDDLRRLVDAQRGAPQAWEEWAEPESGGESDEKCDS